MALLWMAIAGVVLFLLNKHILRGRMIESATDRILVRLVEVPVPKSNLIIPTKDKQYQIGRVVSSDAYETGIYVWSRRYAGLILEYDEMEYVSLSKEEILGWSNELK